AGGLPVVQGNLFAGVDHRSKSLMDILDKANKKFGRGTVGFASSG
ncbi:putative UV protection and mutation protein, partial [Xanthomonas citri pv. malvacearum str. GSPB2388]